MSVESEDDGVQSRQSWVPAWQLHDSIDSGSDSPRRSPFERCVKSKVCENFTLVVIVVNTVVMAMEADYPDEEYWSTVDDCFLLFYVSEMVSRLAVERQSFFTSDAKGWNIFEFVLVVVGVLDQWILRFCMGDSDSTNKEVLMSARMSRITRFARMSRVLRTFRIFNKFEQMRWVLQGLMRSAVSVFWIAVFLFILILIYAIVIVNIVRDTDNFLDCVEENDGAEAREHIELRFGSVMGTMDTLFTWLTFDDWGDEARSINAIFWWMELTWISYFTLGSFTFLSLITGIAADKMNDVRQEEMGGQTMTGLKELVEMLDEDENSLLDFEEFMELLRQPAVVAKLQHFNIDIDGEHEARALFETLDRGRDSTLTLAELSDLLNMLVTDKLGKHMCIVEGHLNRLTKLVERPYDPADELRRSLHCLLSRVAHVQARVSFAENTLQDLFKLCHFTPT